MENLRPTEGPEGHLFVVCLGIKCFQSAMSNSIFIFRHILCLIKTVKIISMALCQFTQNKLIGIYITFHIYWPTDTKLISNVARKEKELPSSGLDALKPAIR